MTARPGVTTEMIASALAANPTPGAVRTPQELSHALEGVLSLVHTLTNVMLPIHEVPVDAYTLTGTIKGRLSTLIVDSKYLREYWRVELRTENSPTQASKRDDPQFRCSGCGSMSVGEGGMCEWCGFSDMAVEEAVLL